MNPFEMVVMIVAISAVASVLRAKHGKPSRRERREMMRNGLMAQPDDFASDPEAAQMRDEIKQLKDRIHVLERVITETNSAAALDREIDKLR